MLVKNSKNYCFKNQQNWKKYFEQSKSCNYFNISDIFLLRRNGKKVYKIFSQCVNSNYNIDKM